MPLQSGHCRSFTFTLAAIVLYLGGLIELVSSLDCHCSNSNTACDQSNGFCPSGCEKGWFGPGCQVGNLALGKVASQSATMNEPGLDNSAGKATDGLTPALGNDSAQYCTVANPGQSQNPWWYVTLSETEVFVLTNITLVNRQGILDYRLNNFYILFTNDTSGSPPSLANWATCAYEPGSLQDTIQKSYTCSPSLAIGRKVAVYAVSPRPKSAIDTNVVDNVLNLCEVYVYGYQFRECPAGYTGPGCLLRRYNSDICLATKNNTPGDFGGCNFMVCPEKAYLPPDCWRINDSTRTSVSIDVTISVTSRITSREATTLDHLTAPDASTPGGQTAIIAGSVTGVVALVAITVGLVIYSLRSKKTEALHRTIRMT